MYMSANQYPSYRKLEDLMIEHFHLMEEKLKEGSVWYNLRDQKCIIVNRKVEENKDNVVLTIYNKETKEVIIYEDFKEFLSLFSYRDLNVPIVYLLKYLQDQLKDKEDDEFYINNQNEFVHIDKVGDMNCFDIEKIEGNVSDLSIELCDYIMEFLKTLKESENE